MNLKKFSTTILFPDLKNTPVFRFFANRELKKNYMYDSNKGGGGGCHVNSLQNLHKTC